MRIELTKRLLTLDTMKTGKIYRYPFQNLVTRGAKKSVSQLTLAQDQQDT
jgi:hypothetical protein